MRSRFELYGGNECNNCVYHRASKRCERMRCDYPDNLGSNWLGVTYHKRPDEINWNKRCKNYKPKETP